VPHTTRNRTPAHTATRQNRHSRTPDPQLRARAASRNTAGTIPPNEASRVVLTTRLEHHLHLHIKAEGAAASPLPLRQLLHGPVTSRRSTQPHWQKANACPVIVPFEAACVTIAPATHELPLG